MLEVLDYIKHDKDDEHEAYIVNREISWLQFNERVLQEAADPSVPLIEKLRFLGIFSNNLDEFFRVRVATVKRMIDFKKKVKSKLSINPKKLLIQIQGMVLEQQTRFQTIYREILEELEAEGIMLIDETQLTEDQGEFVKKYFYEKVWPTLIPIMIHDVQRFPYLKDKSIYLAIRMWKDDSLEDGRFSLLEIPSRRMSRFLVVPSISEKNYVIILEDIIRYCLREVYSMLDYNTFEAYTIKVTRDAEIDLESDLSKSFLESMKKGLKQRKKAQPVRFVYDQQMPKELLDFFKAKMKLDDDDNLIPGGRYHNFRDFIGFPNLGKASLEYKTLATLFHPDLKPYQSIFRVIRDRDVLLHYPYHKFEYFIDFLREAAIDPQVECIRMTIYRLASQSRVINALINAAKNGKRVVVVLELQARFDEEANIKWSNVLAEEGVEVHHGTPGMKVHSKLCLVSRREDNKLVHYTSIGTGNFNEKTAQIYSDLALFTIDKRISKEVIQLFGIFEGEELLGEVYDHIIPSPTYLRNALNELIEEQIALAPTGNGFIMLKMNSLVDRSLIEKLYEASSAGVHVRLIVRGICSLVPGIPGVSENIEAISIIDRFLEHSRIYIFGKKGNENMYLSSADWMGRNLDSRIEVTCPVYSNHIKEEIWDILDLQWSDNQKARLLTGLEVNQHRKVEEQEAQKRSQYLIHSYYSEKLKTN